MATGAERRRAARRALPPGPPWAPWAQTLAWVAAPGWFMRACERRYGSRFTVQLAGEGPCVYLSAPDDIGRAFTAPGALAGAVNRQLAPVLGERSVLLVDGAEHLEQRRLQLPAFQGAPLERARAVIAATTERRLAAWPEGVVALRPRTQAITLEAILRVALGVEDPERLAVLQRAVTVWLRRASSPLALVPALRRDLGPLSPWRRFVAARTEVHALLDAEIARARAELAAEARAAMEPHRPGPDGHSPVGERRDVVALLVQARRGEAPLGDEEVRDQLVTLLLAGHETTATALAWALHELVHAPAALAATQAEARRGEDGPWTAAVVREALRLHPPIPVVGRKLTERLEFADGRGLPPGTVAVPCAWLVHRRAELYPEPDAFRPERFLGEERPAGAHAWIPYGGGVRRCLGARFAELELRTVLRTVLATLDITAAAPRVEPQRWRAIVLGASRGGRVRVARRAAMPPPPRSAPAASGASPAATG